MNSPTYRFTPAMFRAVTVDRSKTQTRRIITPEPSADWTPVPCNFFHPTVEDRHGELHPAPEVFGAADADFGVIAPYGPPGTIKPVVTTWAAPSTCDLTKPQDLSKEIRIWFNDGSPKPLWAGKSRPAMFFPKHLYGLAPQARCVAVKAERVQDISESDAKSEGIKPVNCGSICFEWSRTEDAHDTAKEAFAALWDSINAERGKGERKGCYAWDKNPWVFATTFELIS